MFSGSTLRTLDRGYTWIMQYNSISDGPAFAEILAHWNSLTKHLQGWNVTVQGHRILGVRDSGLWLKREKTYDEFAFVTAFCA